MKPAPEFLVAFIVHGGQYAWSEGLELLRQDSGGNWLMPLPTLAHPGGAP